MPCFLVSSVFQAEFVVMKNVKLSNATLYNNEVDDEWIIVTVATCHLYTPYLHDSFYYCLLVLLIAHCYKPMSINSLLLYLIILNHLSFAIVLFYRPPEARVTLFLQVLILYSRSLLPVVSILVELAMFACPLLCWEG